MPLVAGSVADLARAPELRVALDWFRRERAWINEQHLKLCRVPAPTFLEQKRAEWMAERFQSLGWESRLDRSGNVVASLPGRRDSASGGGYRAPGYGARAAVARRDQAFWRRPAPGARCFRQRRRPGRIAGPGRRVERRAALAGRASGSSAGRQRGRGRRGQPERYALSCAGSRVVPGPRRSWFWTAPTPITSLAGLWPAAVLK